MQGWSSVDFERNNSLVLGLNQHRRRRKTESYWQGAELAFSGERRSESACKKCPEKDVNFSNKFCFPDVSFENGVAVHTTSGCEHDFCYVPH
jgi:hypothetical protein